MVGTGEGREKQRESEGERREGRRKNGLVGREGRCRRSVELRKEGRENKR